MKRFLVAMALFFISVGQGFSLDPSKLFGDWTSQIDQNSTVLTFNPDLTFLNDSLNDNGHYYIRGTFLITDDKLTLTTNYQQVLVVSYLLDGDTLVITMGDKSTTYHRQIAQ